VSSAALQFATGLRAAAMTVTKTLFSVWSAAMSAAASECVNATLNVTLPAVSDDGGGTAMDAKGNVWFTTVDSQDWDHQRVVIWMCPEDGECVSKRTGESPSFHVAREIAVHTSGSVSIVYLLLPRVVGPPHVTQCIWDADKLDEVALCSKFIDETDVDYDYHLAVDYEGNVFLSHDSMAYNNSWTHTYNLRKCSPSGLCVDFGGDFWESHGFAPNKLALDSQGNLYVTRKTIGGQDAYVAKCTPIGECTETQIMSPFGMSTHLYTEEIAVSPDDDIYMMFADITEQQLIQCSLDSVCNQIMKCPFNNIWTGLSAGKNGDLYTAMYGSHRSPMVRRLCVPPAVNEIQV